MRQNQQPLFAGLLSITVPWECLYESVTCILTGTHLSKQNLSKFSIFFLRLYISFYFISVRSRATCMKEKVCHVTFVTNTNCMCSQHLPRSRNPLILPHQKWRNSLHRQSRPKVCRLSVMMVKFENYVVVKET